MTPCNLRALIYAAQVRSQAIERGEVEAQIWSSGDSRFVRTSDHSRKSCFLDDYNLRLHSSIVANLISSRPSKPAESTQDATMDEFLAAYRHALNPSPPGPIAALLPDGASCPSGVSPTALPAGRMAAPAAPALPFCPRQAAGSRHGPRRLES